MLLTKKPWGTLKNGADEDLLISCTKKKTRSMLPRWDYSTNICTLIISGIGTEKTLKSLVHMKGIIKDHPCRGWLVRRWCVTEDWETVTYNSNKKWTEVAPKYCSKMLPMFYMDFTLLERRWMSLIPHLSHFWCYSEFLTGCKSCTQNLSRSMEIKVSSLYIHKCKLETLCIR